MLYDVLGVAVKTSLDSHGLNLDLSLDSLPQSVGEFDGEDVFALEGRVSRLDWAEACASSELEVCT